MLAEYIESNYPFIFIRKLRLELSPKSPSARFATDSKHGTKNTKS